LQCYADVTVTAPRDPTTQLEPEVLEAAHRAIERHGWRGATLERIAVEAGVSRMTLHRHHVSREGILGALAERLEEQHRETMREALETPGDGRARLLAAFEAECRLAEENLGLTDALGTAARDAIYHEEGRPALTRDSFVAPYRRLLTEETATVLINLVTHTYGHLRRGHGWDPDRARAAVCTAALDGVAA
jgi:AcrR family transcriptional regulator